MVLEAVKPTLLTVPMTGQLLDKQHKPHTYGETFSSARQYPFVIMYVFMVYRQLCCICKLLTIVYQTHVRINWITKALDLDT
jgi:hypothetical protein